MRVSERTILVTVYAAFALGLLAVYRPLLLLVIAFVAAAPFVYLWASWKLSRKRKFYD